MEPGLALICFKYYAFTQDFIGGKGFIPQPDEFGKLLF